MWSEQGALARQVHSGAPGRWNSSAAALLAYDVPHRSPWDWRVSLYTWTKGLAAGVYLVAALLALAGSISWSDSLWLRSAPLVALGMLAVTGAILIADLEHPTRFPLIFLRPQWRSWLVRGAFVIGAYGGVLALHLIGWATGADDALAKWVAIAGIPVAAATAVYTAYLFAQAKARDLWQSPLLPPHMLVQALLLGAAALLPFGHGVHDLRLLLGGTAFAHVLLVLGEVSLTHPTAHAHLAVLELTRGRYAAPFWAGLALAAVAVAAPWIGIAAVGPALLAVLLHEHAYVQSGQAVPLA